MADLVGRKVGIVACSGEELAEGTVARLAALKVLQELRPRDTVTICLPLFLAGGAADRAFARLHPTVTVDGCELRCAANGTEKYSNKPAASLVVNELVAECALQKPEGRRRLNEAGHKAVEITAETLAVLVDQLLAEEVRDSGAENADVAEAQKTDAGFRQVTCSCGSSVPVSTLLVKGEAVEVVALPLIFRRFAESGRDLDEAAARELFETVKIYNAVPPQAEASWREAVMREYAVFLQKERQG